MDHYTIGQLAREADVPISTVRYYEKRGLLLPDRRSPGNYRIYSQAAMQRLLFVRSAQAAGFTLKDIVALLEFQESDAPPCKEVQDLIEARLEQVVEQIKHLKVVDRVLRNWLKVCCQAEQTGRCSVLDALQTPAKKNSHKV